SASRTPSRRRKAPGSDAATAGVAATAGPVMSMNRILLLLLMVVAAMVVSIAANAKPAQPADAVISSITEQVLAQSAALGPAADPAKLKAFIETTVIPRLDFRAMTARAVGPRWRSATDEQKARLMAGFESLLIKTYAGAFAQAAGATY